MSCGMRLLAGVLAIAVCARASITLTGHVVDETNAGVGQARVVFRPAGSLSQMYAVATDPTGAFSAPLPGPGQYLASVERDGYFPLKDFAVDAGAGAPEVHLVLNHVREMFESMKVSASTAAIDVDNTSAERKLTGVEAIDVPYSPARDLRKALTLMPGVVQDRAGSLHFDGGAENQTLYLLDGFNVSNPLSGKLDTRLSVESVRSIEWASGRYPAEFGKGSGGALSIRTDMGDDPWRYSATNFLPGLDTRHGLHLGAWAPRFNLSGPLRRGRAWFSEHLDGEYSQPVVPGLPKGEDRTEIFQGSNLARVQVNLTPSNIFFSDFLTNYTFAPGTGLNVLDPKSTTTDRRSRTWFFSAKDQIYLARGMLLEVGYAEDRSYLRALPQGSAFYQITVHGRRGNGYIDSTQRSRRGQLLANLFLPSFEFAGHHQLKTGIDVDRLDYWQNFRRTGIDVFNAGGALVRETVFGGSGLLSRPGLEAAWYVMDDWKIRSNLVVAAGVRQDWDELIRQPALSPRIGFSWAPFGRMDTKISGGYAVVRDATSLQLFTRPMDQYAIETYYDPSGGIANGPVRTVFEFANQPLKAPRHQNWTAGVERRIPGHIDLRGTYLRKRGDHGLTYVNFRPGIYKLANARRESYDAVEIAAHHRFGGQYEWLASYTRSRARSNAVLDLNVDQPLDVLNNSGPLAWDAPNRFVSWGYLPTRWENWAIAYLLETRSGFPYSEINDVGQIAGPVGLQRFPSYFALNIHPEWKFTLWSRRWALRGGINNITGHQNPTVAQTIPGLPVRLYGSEGRHLVFRVRWLGKAQ